VIERAIKEYEIPERERWRISVQREVLALAEQHIAAERLIARQIQAIAMLKLRGVDTAEAEQTLASFKESAQAFRRHRDSILGI
jgi:hypothetical protein